MIRNNKDTKNNVIQMQLLCLDLSSRVEELQKDKRSDRRIIYILSILCFALGMMSSIMTYKYSTQKVKYAYASPDGKIIPFTMYNTPYLTVKDRIQFMEKVAIHMNSLSWYDREDILTDMYPLFYKSTFSEIIEALESHDIFNKKNMLNQKISSSASVIKGAKLIDDNVRNIKGFPPHLTGEEYELDMLQEIRKNGVVALKLKFRLKMVIVRVDPNIAPTGYKITKYKINTLN